jgi:hypothetical protein
MRVVTRAKLAMCPDCQKEHNARTGENICRTNPSIAAQWHPRRNVTKRPAEDAWWVCDFGHEYPMRIERRTAGGGCSVCARRRLVPGVTDLATQEPVMVREFHPYPNGPLEPHEIFPRRCTTARHVTHQTVQHRRQSAGCTACEREDRILVRAEAA